MGLGWKHETVDVDGELMIDCMEGPPAPAAILELLECKCKRSCQPTSCICIINKMKILAMCKLQNCANQEEATDHNSEVGLSSDDEVEEIEFYLQFSLFLYELLKLMIFFFFYIEYCIL